MEAQEIFDTVAKHLFKQGCRSVEDNDEDDPACLYRGPEGRMCAVGVLIPDDAYEPSMEYKNVTFLIAREGSKLPAWLQTNDMLLRRLQVAHDRVQYWVNGETMRAFLRRVAAHHGVSAAVLDGLAFAWEDKAEERV